MKEKTEEFFSNGYHLLTGVWINVAFMIAAVVIGILQGEWLVCIFGLLVYLPWLLYFINMYMDSKRDRRLMENLLVIENILNASAEKIRRYEEVYGKLPEDIENESVDKETLKEA